MTEEGVVWARGLTCAGVDEAGRGPLFGPLMVAVVVLDRENLPEAYDSKALGSRRREELAAEVREKALACSVGAAEAAEIDSIGISRALKLASSRALSGLSLNPSVLLVDGPRDITGAGIECVCLVKGEQRSRSIAAASLLAKVQHDEVIRSMAVLYPEYGLERNMGYGTQEHMAAIRRLGPTEHHRKSFKPVAAAVLN